MRQLPTTSHFVGRNLIFNIFHSFTTFQSSCSLSDAHQQRKPSYIHHVRVKEPSAASPYKGNTDLLLIKHLAETHNRHYATHHKHSRPKVAPSRTRNKRRPKPVYGPPTVHQESNPIDNYDLKYAQDDDSSFKDQAQPASPTHHQTVHHNQQQHQHISFGEPPEETSFTPIDSSIDYAPKEPERIAPASIYNLPIEPNSNHYMLPPSTSYGVPVAPIINVYPDKLEYMHSNLASPSLSSSAFTPTSSNSLYNILNKLKSPNNGAASHISEDTASSNQPLLHFAEPLPDYYPGFSTTFTTPSSPRAGIQFHSVPDQPLSEPETSLDDDQFDDINDDRVDEFGIPSSALSKISYEYAESSNHRSISKPQPRHQLQKNHNNKFRDQTVERFLERYNNGTTLGAAPQRSHTLDNDDLRNAYANDFSRFRFAAASVPKPARFGQRIPKARVPETTTTTRSSANVQLLTGTSSSTQFEDGRATKPVPVDTTASSRQTADVTTDTTTTAASPILVLLSAKNNDTNTTLRSHSGPSKRDTISSGVTSARLRKYRSPALHSRTSMSQYDQLNIGNLTKRLFDNVNVEILSVEPSKSHSFYAGIVTPTTTTNTTSPPT